jgi:hypothetical protein
VVFWFFEIKGILFEDSIGLEFCDGSHDGFLFVVCFLWKLCIYLFGIVCR